MLAYLRYIFSPKENLSFLGLCFLQAWMHVISQNVVANALDFQLAFHIGLCASLVLVALCSRRIEAALPSPGLDWVSAIGMCLTPLAGLVLPPDQHIALLGCAFLSGMGIAYFFAKWFYIFSRMKTKDAYSIVLLSFSLGACIRFVFALISSISFLPILVVALTLPFLSLWTSKNVLSINSGLIAKAAQGAIKPSSRKLAVFLIVQVFVYAAIFGNGVIFSVLQSSIPGSIHENTVALINYALRIVFPLLLFFWIASQSESPQYRTAANTIVLVLAFILLMLWFLGDSSLVIAYSVISLARNLVIILLYLALIKLSHAAKQSSLAIFGVGRGLYELSVVCGILAYSKINSVDGGMLFSEDFVYPIAICVFIFLAGCFFATAQNLREDPAILPISEADRSTAAFESAKQTFALSDRELEIMKLLYKGHSKKGIADALYLSENTVRWHSQRLYKKLKIHSREELLVIINDIIEQ